MLDSLVSAFGYGNFIVVLSFLVFIHELGHYSVARWCGVKVEVFSIGFGKEIFGWTDRHGTRWKFSLIPLGGYVKMFGEMSPISDALQQPDKNIARSFTTDDEFRSLHSSRKALHHKNVWQRMAIVAAGPAANFLLAIVGLALLAFFVGKPVPQNFSETGIDSVQAGSPAQRAGLQAGDLVLSVNAQQIESFAMLISIVQNSQGQPLRMEIDRYGSRQFITVSPQAIESETNAKPVYRLGITAKAFTYEKTGLYDSVVMGVQQTWFISRQTLTAIGEIVTGQRGTEELGGPVRIAQMSNEFGQAGLRALFYFMIILSINLGLLNLLPVPVLDGGYLVFFMIEAIMGKPVPAKIQQTSLKIGLMLLIGLMIFMTLHDILRF